VSAMESLAKESKAWAEVVALRERVAALEQRLERLEAEVGALHADALQVAQVAGDNDAFAALGASFRARARVATERLRVARARRDDR